MEMTKQLITEIELMNDTRISREMLVCVCVCIVDFNEIVWKYGRNALKPPSFTTLPLNLMMCLLSIMSSTLLVFDGELYRRLAT